MTSLLQKILSGQERGKLILIEDDSPDVNIVLPFTINFINHYNHLGSLSPVDDAPHSKITLISNELRPYQVQSWITQSTRLSIVDLIGDLTPLNMDSPANELIKELLRASQNSSLIILDSLTHLICTQNLPNLIECLQTLEKDSSSVICFLHRHCHSESAISRFESLASIIVNVSNDPTHQCYVAACTLRKKDARRGLIIKQSKEFIKIGTNLLIDLVNPNRGKETSEDQQSNASVPESMDLPFKLSLKETERQAKESMVLPYQKTAESKVFYIPGKEDDIDDEDPDDDLDF